VKKLVGVLLTVAVAVSLMVVPAVASANPGAPTIDGVIGVGEWGDSLCVKSDYGESVTVYAIATTEALFMAFDSTDNLDERAVEDTTSGANDVLDWNVGLVGSDMTNVPWRYALRTKAQSDNSWGGFFSTIDELEETGRVYRGCWEDTENPNLPDYYYPIPAGLEMVTSFDTGHRVTEVKVPMSLMFDGEHGWDGPNAGDVLLLGGLNVVEPDAWPGEWQWDHGHLFWPEGIDHGNADTYAEVTIQANTAVGLTAETSNITAINVDPTSIDFGTITPGTPNDGDTITVENIGGVTVDVDAYLDPMTTTVFNYLKLGGVPSPGYCGDWADYIISGLKPSLNQTLTTQLVVPETYSGKGIEIATLVFEATAA